MVDKLSRNEFMAIMIKKLKKLSAARNEEDLHSGDENPEAEGETDPFEVTKEHFIAFLKEQDYFPVVAPRGKMAAKLKAAAPFNMFYTTITAAPETLKHPLSITFQELLDPSLGALECSLQITCYLQPDWLLAHYKRAGYSDKPLTVIYGELVADGYEDEYQTYMEEKDTEAEHNVEDAAKAHEGDKDENKEEKDQEDKNIDDTEKGQKRDKDKDKAESDQERDRVEGKGEDDNVANVEKNQERDKDEENDENVEEVENGRESSLDKEKKDKDEGDNADDAEKVHQKNKVVDKGKDENVEGAENYQEWYKKEKDEKENEDEIVVPENVEVQKVKMPLIFGLAHCKMMILCYEDGSLRIVIATANLKADDWDLMTQGVWISGSCPRLPSGASPEDGESRTYFKKDLLQFLNTYESPYIAQYYERLQCADLSHINVCLVASVPGFHHGVLWGMRRMEYLLSRHCIVPPHEASRWEVYAQSSGMGGFGKKPQFWLLGPFLRSFSRALYEGRRRQLPPIRIIFPSLANTLAGHDGCSACPYSDEVHKKQRWLEGFLCEWKADSTARSGSMPHVKSYVRVSPDRSRAAFFLLTSANISKSAWGSPYFYKDPLRIFNYEAGVLFLPKFVVGADYFNLSEGARNRLLLPYDVPLTPYTRGMTTPFRIELFRAVTEDVPSASTQEESSSEPK